MNLADLCPEGLEKYAEFEKQNNAYQRYEKIHMLMFMIRAHQEFLEHIQECEFCKEE